MTIALVVVAALLGLALLRAAGIGRLRPAAASRLALLRAGLAAVAALALLRLLVPWGETPTWTWWPPALLLALGLAAAARRLAVLPTLDPRRPPGRQVVAAAVDGAIVTGVLVALLV